MTTLAPTGTSRGPIASAIEVVMSDRVEEADAALRLIHDGFVESGYVVPQPSGRRLHASYLNPGTFFALARMDGVPVGATVLMPDGPFGLPSDRAFAEEIDALRATPGGTLFEAGSLAVGTAWRRHTRRIYTRLMATLIRGGLEMDPDARVVFSIAPESARFYVGLFGLEAMSEPRPLYGAPAVLIGGDARVMVETFATALTSAQRGMHELMEDPDPAWLVDRREDEPLPAAWLVPLIEEQGLTPRLTCQLALLGARYPAALMSLLHGSGAALPV
jgi:hypothetical protein